jgi:hypothetical protein
MWLDLRMGRGLLRRRCCADRLRLGWLLKFTRRAASSSERCQHRNEETYVGIHDVSCSQAYCDESNPIDGWRQTRRFREAQDFRSAGYCLLVSEALRASWRPNDNAQLLKKS